MKKMSDWIELESIKMAPQKQNSLKIRGDEFFSVIENEWKDEIRVLSYSRGCLTLGIASSSRFQEAVQFYADDWLKRMKNQGSPIKKIKWELIDSLEDFS